VVSSLANGQIPSSISVSDCKFQTPLQVFLANVIRCYNRAASHVKTDLADALEGRNDGVFQLASRGRILLEWIEALGCGGARSIRQFLTVMRELFAMVQASIKSKTVSGIIDVTLVTYIRGLLEGYLTGIAA